MYNFKAPLPVKDATTTQQRVLARAGLIALVSEEILKLFSCTYSIQINDSNINELDNYDESNFVIFIEVICAA